MTDSGENKTAAEPYFPEAHLRHVVGPVSISALSVLFQRAGQVRLATGLAQVLGRRPTISKTEFP
jgi:hypothetical protein